MTAASAWGLTGVGFLFGYAVVRLGIRGVETILSGLAPGEWLALVLFSALFVWGEGVRALQHRYVPFVVERARALVQEDRRIYDLLAPLYVMALIGARPGLLLRAWAGTAAIGLAVVVVAALPAPWRGIVDFAVAAALAWGLLALIRQGVAGAHGSPQPPERVRQEEEIRPR